MLATEIGRGLERALVRELVERPVVELAYVGYDANAQPLTGR